jgi:O-antigen/teichoic acid export membrane protein
MLGALAAPVHAAAFVAARSLLQPLQILLRGFDIADKMRFSEVAGGSAPGNPLTLTLKIAGTYAVIGAMFGGVVVLFADRIIVLAYGAKFAEHSAALIAWVPVYVLLSITLPLESLVYARGDFARYYAVRGLASVVALAAAYPLIVRYDEIGAIVACGIGWFLAVAGTLALVARKAPA